MASIEIPEGYWTIQPAGFAARLSGFSSQFSAIAGGVVLGAAPVLNGNDAALRGELATVDGDADAIQAAAATNRTALDTTPTDAAIAALGLADGKTAVGDEHDATAAGWVIPGLEIADPASVLTGPPPEPGGHEPPPRDPDAPPPPIIAQLDALYLELLGRHIDDSGLNTWLGEIAVHHHDVAWVREQILASPEYQQRQAAAPPPPSAPPPSEPAPAPVPPDLGAYVTHDQLRQVLENFETTITLVV